MRFSPQYAHAFSSVKEVVPVEIGVCIQSGDSMSPDSCVFEQQESVLFCPKYPVSVPFRVPVSPGYPFVPFIGMSMFTPLLGNCPYIAVKEPECPLGSIVAMVIGPPLDNQVQGQNQAVLCPGLCLSDNRRNLFRDCLDRLPRRLYQERSFIFPEVVSKKVEPVVNMGNHRLLHG